MAASRVTSRLVSCVAALLLGAVAAVWTQPPAPSVAEGAERARLAGLQREAVHLVNRAARSDTPPDDMRRALLDASQRLESLAAAQQFAPTLQAELQKGQRNSPPRLDPMPNRESTSGPSWRCSSARASQLEGAIALGLTLQGSYSQSKPREPVVGRPRLGDGTGAAAPSPDDEADSDRPAGAVAGAVRGSRTPADADLLRWADQGPHPRIGRQRRRAGRLRRRRPARHLSRHRGRAHADARARAASQRALSQPAAAGSSRTSRRTPAWTRPPGATACAPATSTTTGISISTSPTGGRTSCSATAATARSRRSPAARRRRGRRLEHRLHVPRRGCRRRPGSVRRALRRRRRGTRWCAPSARWSGATGLASWPGPPDFPASPICSSRTSATGASSRRPRRTASSDPARAYGFGVVATDYDDDGFVDLFVANDSNPNFLYRNLGNGRFESVGLLAGVAVNDEARAQAGMGADAGDYDGDGRAGHRAHGVRARPQHALSQRGRPAVRGRQHGGGPGRHARSCAWAGARRFSTPISTAGSISSSPTATSSRTSTTTRSSARRTVRRTRSCSTSARASATSRPAPAAALQIARVGRGLAIGDLDNDGDPDVVVSNMDDAPTLLENRQRTGHHWLAVRVTCAHRQPVRDRREGHRHRRWPDAGARDSIGRQLSVAERPARVLRTRRLRPGRWRSRSGCLAARAGDGTGLPPTACTCSTSRRPPAPRPSR